MGKNSKTVRICMGTGCKSNNADGVKDAFDKSDNDHSVDFFDCGDCVLWTS